MSVRSKYFVFNKESDYIRGCLSNVVYGDGRVKLDPSLSVEQGTFFSRLLDSREKEARWHRIAVKSESMGDASIRFSFYVSEERFITTEDKVWDIAELISDASVKAEKKKEIFSPYLVKRALNPKDALISEARGRYLWFAADLYGLGDESPEIGEIRIDLDTLPWVSYLPEIYQGTGDGQSFTERFLSIFQSFYEDLGERLDNIASMFDPSVADSEVLQWLASWIDLDDPFIWSENQLRWIVLNSGDLYKRRGTRQCVSDMVELYTGKKPYIIEQYDIEKYRENESLHALMHQLYGDHPYQFTVIVDENCVPSNAEFRTLVRIIDSVKPAGIEVNLVVLKPYIFLSRYSYLGINSCLGQYRAASLDGFSTLPFTNIAEPMQEEYSDCTERKGEML